MQKIRHIATGSCNKSEFFSRKRKNYQYHEPTTKSL